MTDASARPTLVLLVALILLNVSTGHPVGYQSVATNPVQHRFERSLQPACGHKKHLQDIDGTIAFKQGHGPHARHVSCSWIIHVPRGTLAQLEFFTLNIEDSCPGVCRCNYLAVRDNTGRTRYCNERKPPRGLLAGDDKVRIHLRLKANNQTGKTSFVMRYSTMSGKKSTKFAPKQKSDKNMLTHYIEKNARQTRHHDNDAAKARVRKLVPTAPVTDVIKTLEPTQDPGPSKLTILLAIAIPVVLIFVLVVLLIAYYNYYTDMKQKESGEDIPKTGTTISDMIMNSSVTLTPMFNLGKARRESTQRKEKANKLYDDMLQNWRLMNADKKKREQAKEESVNTWESYKKYKQRRATRDSEDNNNQAFAMLVSNAINVATKPGHPQEPQANEKGADTKETVDEVEEKPRTNRNPRKINEDRDILTTTTNNTPSSKKGLASILIKRSSDSIRNSRGSKVLSWSDISTTKPVEEDVHSKPRTKSETELKTIPRGSRGSSHIPAIVVSQPSVDTEDDESEANDTDRLIKDDKDSPGKLSEEPNQSKTVPTYSCSEHVKDILRESYGEEVEDWFQKPKKSSSQGSLQNVPDSNVKYQAMKTNEGNVEDDDID